MTREKQYLEKVLTLNPILDCGKIFELRKQFLMGNFKADKTTESIETIDPNHFEPNKLDNKALKLTNSVPVLESKHSVVQILKKPFSGYIKIIGL